MLLVGFTPGPNNPKDLDSFLWPLVEEMLNLHEGIRMAWNAGLGEYFTLHAYITIVTADMPGREKLMHMKGKNPRTLGRGLGAMVLPSQISLS
jgi:hypothetical protein